MKSISYDLYYIIVIDIFSKSLVKFTLLDFSKKKYKLCSLEWREYKLSCTMSPTLHFFLIEESMKTFENSMNREFCR
jgi:hypothetical protein